MVTGTFLEWKHRHLFLLLALALVVVALLYKNWNNFHKAFSQLQSTPLHLLAHVIFLKSAELQKETPGLIFAIQRDSITFLMCHLLSSAHNFPSWFETVILYHWRQWELCFAIQFNNSKQDCILFSVTPVAKNFSLTLYNNLTFKQSCNYPLPKVFSLWAKLCDPDQTEVREGQAGSPAPALLVSFQRGGFWR